MLHALGLNFKIGLKFLWRFLIIVFVVNLANGSPRASMLVWPVKILIFFYISYSFTFNLRFVHSV